MEEEIIKFGKLLYDKDLTSATSGNMSVRQGNIIYITSTGSALGMLTDKEVAIIDLDGNEIKEGVKASSEKFLHMQIYKMRPDINAVIHCHSPFATAFAACRKELADPIISENTLSFGKIPVADYAMPSSQQLTDNTSKLFAQYDTVLMANHGIVAGAATLKQAFFKIETAETYAKTCVYANIVGNPVCLSENDVKDLENLKKKLGK